MLKRKIALIICLVLIVSAISGCQQDPSKSSEKALPHITVVTAPMGSGWHAVSVLLSDLWMTDVPGLNVSVLEGGSVANIRAISAGIDANFGWAYTTDLRDANLGEGTFDQKYEDALIVGVMYPVWLNVITLENSKIKTMEDLKGAKINAGAIGTGSEIAVQRLLESYGLNYDIIKSNGGTVSFGNYTDAATQLKDGIIDVMLGGGAPDIPAVHEVDAQQPVKLIPTDEYAMSKLLEKEYGYSVSLPIPANTYKNQNEDVAAIAYPSVMIANKDLPEDLVYELTKSLWTHIEKIRTEQPARGNYMRLETVFDGINKANLHPGAVRYYKEIGILD